MKGFFICPACKGNGYRRIIKDNDPKEKVEIDCQVCNNQGEIKDNEKNRFDTRYLHQFA
jgi:DnaJ-class molecular chaperone